MLEEQSAALRPFGNGGAGRSPRAKRACEDDGAELLLLMLVKAVKANQGMIDNTSNGDRIERIAIGPTSVASLLLRLLKWLT